MGYEKLNNTRDLGGMTTVNGGRIRPGRLIRSGRLCLASAADRELLARTVSAVADFRSEREVLENPDPELPGVAYCHLPIFRERQAGVTREKDSDREAMRLAFEDPEATVGAMRRIYANFVADEYSVSQYRRFLQIVLKDHEKAVLWHCTAGKDRAGFASVIVQELLGVDREAVMADYLLTNENIREECEELVRMTLARRETPSEKAEEAAKLFFSAQRVFLEATYEKADELYGSFEGFLTEGLGVTADDREKLREMYLE